MSMVSVGFFRRFVVADGRDADPWHSSKLRLGLRPLCIREEMSGGVRGARLDGAVLELVLDVAWESGGERELFSVEGVGERDGGRGTWVGASVSIGVEGVITTAVGAFAFAFPREVVDLPVPLGAGGMGSSWMRSGRSGRSTTLGRPVWGPARFRTDEKCSQSW
jgi:hypothetical protein